MARVQQLCGNNTPGRKETRTAMFENWTSGSRTLVLGVAPHPHQACQIGQEPIDMHNGNVSAPPSPHSTLLSADTSALASALIYNEQSCVPKITTVTMQPRGRELRARNCTATDKQSGLLPPSAEPQKPHVLPGKLVALQPLQQLLSLKGCRLPQQRV